MFPLQYGDTTHTFIDRSLYSGPFLPGYAVSAKDPLSNKLYVYNIAFSSLDLKL